MAPKMRPPTKQWTQAQIDAIKVANKGTTQKRQDKKAARSSKELAATLLHVEEQKKNLKRRIELLTQKTDVVFATQNVHGGRREEPEERSKRLIRMLNELDDACIIALQEVHPDTLDVLETWARENGYKCSGQVSESRDNVLWCITLFDASFDIISSTNDNNAHIVSVYYWRSKTVFHFANVHLKAGRAPENENKRLSECECICNKLNEMCEKNFGYIVIAGDFNSSPPESLYTKIGETFSDLRGPDAAFTHRNLRGEERILDYIWVDGNICCKAVYDCEHDEDNLSDHRGFRILVDFFPL
jgi:endonuclease/exonuclease/phosphatase family metal-dependent hydrolase